MIKATQSILPSDARDAATTSAARRASGSTSFATAMRTAAAKTETETKTESKSKTETKAESKTATTSGPRNEKLQKVDGHKYSEIVGGPRNGMYLNQSGNERDGQAFLKVEREGRSFHIYGTGRDRVVFEIEHDKADTPAATTPVASTGGVAPPA